MDRSPTILVIDDDARLAGQLQTALEGEGMRIGFRTRQGVSVERVVGDGAQVVVLAGPLDAPLRELAARLRSAAPLVPLIVLVDANGVGPALVRELGLHAVYGRDVGAASLAAAVVAAWQTHEQLRQLHTTERIKSELLADVSHEFRTPLNVILGYLDLLSEGAFGPLPPEAAAVHGKLQGNASFLLDLVEEFLDLTRAESSNAPAHHDAIDLRPLLHDLGESFTLLVQDRPVMFRTAIPVDLPPAAGDPAKVRVIVQNLLANAAKFTRAGEIALVAETHDTGVAIRVTDTGPGIPVHEQERIFDLFHQSGSASDRAKGIGLGLALARRFATVLGGSLRVASEVGVGTTFTLWLPAIRRRAA